MRANWHGRQGEVERAGNFLDAVAFDDRAVLESGLCGEQRTDGRLDQYGPQTPKDVQRRQRLGKLHRRRHLKMPPLREGLPRVRFEELLGVRAAPEEGPRDARVQRPDRHEIEFRQINGSLQI